MDRELEATGEYQAVIFYVPHVAQYMAAPEQPADGDGSKVYNRIKSHKAEKCAQTTMDEVPAGARSLRRPHRNIIIHRNMRRGRPQLPTIQQVERCL